MISFQFFFKALYRYAFGATAEGFARLRTCLTFKNSLIKFPFTRTLLQKPCPLLLIAARPRPDFSGYNHESREQ
ncbi:MAG: hypothetical protein SPL30_03080 [Succinivibrio sp.]|nr:hypothetical protein [Succinivibrio sp.]